MKISGAYMFRADILTTLAMFGFIVYMAVEQSLEKRLFLLLPIVLLFIATKVLFAMEFSKKK
ncbi:MAG: hypothetical protein ACP5N9_02455 [Candidatus Bilamarchaeum sp.]|jgi:uncharacterized membrane protein YeiB